MSTLSSISSSYSSMASYLFSKIDSKNKGYIDESDLSSAFSTLSTTSGVSTSDIFTQLDSDSDGKVTESEFSSALKSLAQALDSQYDQTRMSGAMPPPPPPPPTGDSDDSGFTQDELSSQLDEIGSSDSARSTLISSIVQNFDAADTNGDGKVSRSEAMAYAQANNISTGHSSSSTTSSATSTSSTSSTSTSDAQIYRQIMELMRAYGSGSEGNTPFSSLTSAVSTSA